MSKVVDHLKLQILGEIELVHLLDGCLSGRKLLVARQENLVTDIGYDELLPEIVGRNPNAVLANIVLGKGGDYTAGGVFTGARVAPDVTDTAMRVEFFRAPIVNIEFPGAGQVKFTGLIREAEAVSAAEIDEFGLMSYDDRMFSHSINPLSAGPGSPAVKYAKPLGAIYAAFWTLTFQR